MTPERIFTWAVAIVVSVLLVIFLLVVIDRVDDDNDGDGLRSAAVEQGWYA
jgi:hypothetical protein